MLASACDFRVACEKTHFAIPEIKLGIPLTWGALPRLVRDIGATKTKELVMLGSRFTSEDAYRMGFLNRIVEHDAKGLLLQGATRKLCQELCLMSRLTLRMTKRSVDAIASHMVQTRTASWADASHLVAASLDRESSEVRERYIKHLAEGKSRRRKSRL